jgi:predicted Zn-dependent peptidase
MYHKTVLKNGVRIISEKLKHLKSVSLGIWVNAGSRDEDQVENGTFHFIEHMVFKGTHARSSFQIAKELDAIGGLSNAFTGKENTCFHAKVLGKHFPHLADIFSDIFLNSTFDVKDMELERQVILQEIGMTEDNPEDHIHVLFNQQFWIDHPIGMSILGTGETVSGIGKETILKYRHTYYVPEKILVVAAGDVDHQTMVSYFEPLFDSLEASNSNPKRSTPRFHTGVSVHFRDLEQVHVCLGGAAPSQTDEKRFACAVLSTILGGNMSSRLFQEIREKKGLAYSVYSFLSTYLDAGILGVYVATDSRNVNPALETIQTEIRNIIEGDISDSDLAAAVDHLIGGIYLSSESADNRMMRNAKNELVFEKYISYEELVSELEQVTRDDVVEVASGIFHDGKVSLTALGPVKEEEIDVSNLQFR